MPLEIILGDRIASVELLKKDDNKVLINIDGKEYDTDIIMVENGIYSILIENKSYSAELIKGDTNKKYTVNTLYNTYDIEIIDAQSKYIRSRTQGESDDDFENRIFSPIPGKVIKIPVKVGDQIKAGETVIVVEAMKMQSEYKVKKDCLVKEILVNEGDTVNGNQTLMVME